MWKDIKTILKVYFVTYFILVAFWIAQCMLTGTADMDGLFFKTLMRIADLAHIIIFWYMIPKMLYRAVRRKLDPDFDTPLTDEQIIENWISKARA